MKKKQYITWSAVWIAIWLILGVLCPLKVHAIGLPPSIAVQPSDQTVTNMGSVTFSVTVDASLSLTTHYQWQFNGNDLKGPGAQGTKLLTLLDPKITYTQPNNTAANAGVYSVILTSTFGASRTSSNAVLKVVSAPVTVTRAQPSTNGFQIHLDGITGANFVVYASTNLTTWTPIYTNTSQSGAADYVDTAHLPSRYYKVVVQ